MFLVKFTVQGEKQLARALTKKIPANLKINTKLFYLEAGNIVKTHSENAFSSSGGNIETGPKWARLKPATVKQKMKKSFPTVPLIRTGKLAGGMALKMHPMGVEIHNKYMNAYGKYHQSNKPRNVLPRRLFLELDIKSKAEIMRSLQVQIHNAINK